MLPLVELGPHEKRTGIVCLGAQSAFAGKKLREEQHPGETALDCPP